MKRSHWIMLAVLVAATAFIVYQQRTAPYRQLKGNIFGTFYTITYQSAEDLEADIVKAMEGVDRSLSMFNAESTISKINRGETSRMDNHLSYLLPKALKISEKTGGAFDVTVAPLVNAWGFGFKNDSLPSPAAIDSIRAFIGYKRIAIADHDIKREDTRTMIDLSAIAKGYGSDIVAKVLDNAKVANYMVEIGGEIVVKGKNSNGKVWKIGIQRPEEGYTGQSFERVVEITDRTMATSGNYRNYYDKDGKRIVHTIDPRTGEPIQSDILSATVIANHCFEADAYATAFMVLGMKEAQQIIKQNPHLEAYLIYTDKEGNKKMWHSTEQ